MRSPEQLGAPNNPPAKTSEARTEEQRTAESAEKAREAFAKAEELVKKIESSALPVEAKRRLSERVMSAAKTVTKRLAQAAFYASLVVFVHAGTHYLASENVTEQKDAEGEPEYHHSDKTTEHLLNYLAGKEPLSEEEKFEIVRQVLKDLLKNQKVPALLPAHYDTMPREQLAELYGNEIEFTPEHPLPKDMTRQGYAETKIQSMQDDIPTSYDFDLETYKAMWKTERDVGAPNIRWMYAYKPKEIEGRPHYRPFTNTMYVMAFGYVPHPEFFAEAAHAQQYRNEPVESYLNTAKEGLRLSKKILKGKAPYAAYEEEYDHPGSIEFAAHKVIEPQLIQRYTEDAPELKKKLPKSGDVEKLKE